MATYVHSFFALFLLISFNQIPSIAINDVESLSTSMLDYYSADTVGTVHITLWFNFTIYQYTLPATTIAATFIAYRQSSPMFTTLGSSNCHKPSYNMVPEAKIMIENNHGDAVVIDKMNVTTTSGTWYGFDAICIDESSTSYQPAWRIYDAECGSQEHYTCVCVDYSATDCGPYKQIISLDTSRPNTLISNAVWSNGVGVTPQIKTCNPTLQPTAYPTINPTILPSKHPSSPPTSSPSKSPTLYPTIYPTRSPSVSPTIYPTTPPTISPTHIPTVHVADSQIASSHPSPIPTVAPTVKQAQNGSSTATQLLLMFVAFLLVVCVCLVIAYLLSLLYKLGKQKRRKSRNTVQSISAIGALQHINGSNNTLPPPPPNMNDMIELKSMSSRTVNRKMDNVLIVVNSNTAGMPIPVQLMVGEDDADDDLLQDLKDYHGAVVTKGYVNEEMHIDGYDEEVIDDTDTAEGDSDGIMDDDVVEITGGHT